MTTNNDTQSAMNGAMKSIINFVMGALLAIVMAWAGMLQTQIKTLDERMYTMKSEMVTDAKLGVMKSEIMGYIDTRINDVASKQEITIRMIDKLDSRLENVHSK
ncbi:hypothetical protein [Pseudomonas phage vB_PseuGesM_254]|uniref:Holin n=1 Tax=Pseudomonas phage vB_PseuGesM_254 TaxID=3092638 RepID=A0AAX4G6J1_9CAUD|nr:hypothetical protein [Pseudomonas phage PseuGes_254]